MGQIEYTNQLRKYVRSLHTSKYGQKYDKFIAEGPKVCKEYLIYNKYAVQYIFCTNDWYSDNYSELSQLNQSLVIKLKEKELAQISNFKTANKVLLVLEKSIGEYSDYKNNNWALFLDRIQDPGNMGTIIRIADWYKIQKIYLSAGCVDVYNHKVVQSAMGSHNRIDIKTVKENFLETYSRPIYGLELGGANINDLNDPQPGLIAIGNESRGFSAKVKNALSHSLMIPKQGGAESLNAAVACGIACHLLTSSK